MEEKELVGRLIQRYICKRLLSSVFLVAVISATLFFVISVILWSPGMVSSGCSEHDIFLKVLCVAPWFLGNIYPAVIGVGTLVTFAFLSQHNEIIPLQAAGLSKMDFVRIIFIPALLLGVFGFFLIAFLAPMSYKVSQHIEVRYSTTHSAWFKEKNNIIYVKKMGTHALHNIFVFDLTKSNIEKLYIAKEAMTGNLSELYSVLIKHYKKSIVTEKTKQEMIWPGLFPNTEILRQLSASQRRLNLFQLYQLIKIQKTMGLSVASYQLRFWRMVLLPFFSLILTFAIMPFAFQERRSKNLSNTAMIGLAISIIFYFFNQTAWSIVVILNLPVFLGALIPLGFVVIFCLLYLKYRSNSI